MSLEYFDSSVFLAINGEPAAINVRALLRELKAEGRRVSTSIITIQEVSVLSFRAGTNFTDNYSKVSRLARIQGVNRDIALTAAKLEAHARDHVKLSTTDEQQDFSRRRKWDCLHVATAIHLGCRCLYTLDPGMRAFQKRMGISPLQFSEPVPKRAELFPEEPRTTQ